MTEDDELLRPEGMRALQAVRAENRALRETLHNLRSGVIEATNDLVDLCENDGAVRTDV
ncbi:hypothetical protein M1C59_02755 [Gordonia terrae]|uniref:hypothetical protein n=1 Tax=Gordonia terrae TaxID=2055 RepID=UPI00200AE0AA|nr:hypothetical protein [Gordonia terrae]UPW09794.1 hypothetical protein M1C59_02755 [Gordonia terrae]